VPGLVSKGTSPAVLGPSRPGTARWPGRTSHSNSSCHKLRSYMMSSMLACSRSIAALRRRVRVSCLLFAMGGHARNQQRSPNAALHGVAASSWYTGQDRLQRTPLGCYLKNFATPIQHFSSTNGAGRNRGRSQRRQNDPQSSGIRFYLYV
jgi:hypothetical protein